MTSWLDDELAECRFADVRLGKRFRTLLKRLSEGIGETIPMAWTGPAPRLSITHKFGRIEPKLDVGEPGEPTPHDRITRRRITSASKIAAKSGQLYDVEGQRPVYGAIYVAIRNKMIK